MEENTAAVECLILFYINTKHILKTKQLDERVFLDQMTRHCRKCGFEYSNEEIRNTWRNITAKYVELNKTGTQEMREAWKYYEILDSCFEQSDFHNGVYPKFSEEMVWFLIECFLKRKHLEKTQKKNSMLTEIHKDFLHSGYLYITRQDIENKWKYLNSKYDKVKDDPEALNKLPYLQALRGFREKNSKCAVKMIFTRMLTEILIERFTEKKITCVIHGYDSDQVLSEIQSEFRELGFDFTQEEIKDKWTKLTNIFAFLKAKGKHDSSWIYFGAMREHFKDDYLNGFSDFEKELKTERRERYNGARQRSKSVGADARSRYNDDNSHKLIVNIEQLDEGKSPSPKKCREEKKPRDLKRKQSPRKSSREKSPKRSRARSKSRDSEKTDKNKGDDAQTESAVANQRPGSTSKRKNNRLQHLSIDRNINHERRGSSDLGSPGSKVHIINIDESEIDKKSGNITINLPSITKQFSDNEFLPLKKRLRLEEDKGNKHQDESKDITDGFLGFPSSETSDTYKRLKQDDVDSKRLTESEMEEILKRIHEDKPENLEFSNIQFGSKQSYYTYSNNQVSYNSFNPPCLLIPKEEQSDNLALQSYSSNTITPPPVLLLVIKVDGNNPIKDNKNPDKQQIEKNLSGTFSKNEILVQNNLNVVKPISPKKENSPVKKSENSTCTLRDLNGTQTRKIEFLEDEKAVRDVDEVPTVHNNIQIKTNNLINLVNPTGKNCSVTLNENVKLQSKEIEVANKSVETMPPPTAVERNEERTVFVDTVPHVASETIIPATVPQEVRTQRIRLPVKGGGNVKEIFISPKELKKLAKIRPGDFKPTTSPTKINECLVKNTPEVNATPHISPKIKFISQVIKPPTVKTVLEPKSEHLFQKPKDKVNAAAEASVDVNCMLPPPAITASKFLGSNNSSAVNRNSKVEEFENESVFSEAVGDDECLKDNLLATVIDFQEQNNQEFVEIKNLMKQNNLLQRETNRLLRLMLEKM